MIQKIGRDPLRLFVEASIFLYGATLIILPRFYLFIPDLLAIVAIGLALKRRLSLPQELKVLACLLAFTLALTLLGFALELSSFGYFSKPARGLLYIFVGALILYAKPRATVFFLGLACGMPILLFRLSRAVYEGETRPDLWSNPIIISNVAIGIFALLLYGWKSKSKISRGFFALCQLLCLTIPVLTQTRGALFSAIAVIAFLTFSLKPRALSSLKISLVSIAGLTLLCLYSPLGERISLAAKETTAYFEGDKAPTSVGVRLELWRASLLLATKRPLSGFGDEGSKKELKSLFESGEILLPTIPDRPHFHSDYFEALATRGIPGFLSVIAMYGVPFFLLFRLRKHGKILSLAGRAFIVSYAASSLTDVPLRNGLTNMFYQWTVILLIMFLLNEKHRLTSRSE